MKIFKRYDKKKLEFIRWDWKWIGFGVFLGRGNYVKGRGVEIFTNQYRTCPKILCPFIGWHIGWTKPYYGKKKFFRLDWSGSGREPYSSWTFRIWRFGIGTDTPKWIQNIISKRNARKWDEGFAALAEKDPSLTQEPDDSDDVDWYPEY